MSDETFPKAPGAKVFARFFLKAPLTSYPCASIIFCNISVSLHTRSELAESRESEKNNLN
jgi:hypothetical protein